MHMQLQWKDNTDSLDVYSENFKRQLGHQSSDLKATICTSRLIPLYFGTLKYSLYVRDTQNQISENPFSNLIFKKKTLTNELSVFQMTLSF